jgi:hypothetical protein
MGPFFGGGGAFSAQEKKGPTGLVRRKKVKSKERRE